MQQSDQRPVLICGLGRIGRRVLESVRASGTPIIAIDNQFDPDDPLLAGITFFQGDCRKTTLLKKAGIDTVRGCIIVTSDDLVNVATALVVRRLNSDCRIVVRMFNQNLIPRLGAAVSNTTALSVSALTAPLIAMTAMTGSALGAVRLNNVSEQITELRIRSSSPLIGHRIADLCAWHHVLVVGHQPRGQSMSLLQAIKNDTLLSLGDRVIVCGLPGDVEPLLIVDRSRLIPGVRWAGWFRRIGRTIRRTFKDVDFSLKAGSATLFLTLLLSTLLFRYGIGTSWVDGAYETVNIIATGEGMHGEDQPGWVKIFLSVMKIAGALLIAGFTAIFTEYLINAKLGGALEARKIPDSGHVVVCGLGNIGFRCVEELLRMGKPVVAIELNSDNPFASTVRRMNVPVIIGDVTVAEVLRQARAETARGVIAATSNELVNLEVGLLVREMNPEQRVVLRLFDDEFARAIRDSADIKHALSIPTLAAPAFAAALYGDRVQTLISIGGRTLAIVDLVVQPNDPCLCDTPLVAAMIDYHFLPIAVSDQEPFPKQGIPKTYRIKADDTLTVMIEPERLNQLLRRESAPQDWAIRLEKCLPLMIEAVAPIVRMAKSCTQEEAVVMLKNLPITLAEKLTRGEAEELLARVKRERTEATIIPQADAATS